MCWVPVSATPHFVLLRLRREKVIDRLWTRVGDMKGLVIEGCCRDCCVYWILGSLFGRDIAIVNEF